MSMNIHLKAELKGEFCSGNKKFDKNLCEKFDCWQTPTVVTKEILKSSDKLKSFIIKKENFFNWVEDKQISKVEIADSYNKTLRDKSLCKIYVYFKLQPMVLETIFGACKKEVENVKISSDHAFLNGIQSHELPLH